MVYSTASQLEEIECSPKTSSIIHPGRLKQMSSTQPNAVIMSLFIRDEHCLHTSGVETSA